MNKSYKILAIIPARKGSKGILSKNTKLINNKPLISWTIEAAKRSKYIDKIKISSDCLKVKEIANSYDINIENLRPDHLSTDSSSSDEVILHELKDSKNLQFEDEFKKIKFYQDENIRLSSELLSTRVRNQTIKQNLDNIEIEKEKISVKIKELGKSIEQKANIVPVPFVKETQNY